MDIKDMVESLGSESCDVRSGARDKILNCGEEAVPFLMEGLKSDNATTRYNTVKVIGEMKIKNAFDVLEKMLGDEDEIVRRECLGLLFSISQEKALPLVVSSLKNDAGYWVRTRCVNLLGEADDKKQAAEALKQVAEDEDSHISSNAACYLKKMGHPGSLDGNMKKLMGKLKGGDDEIKSDIINYGLEAVPYLLEGLESDDYSIRLRCVELLGGFRAGEAYDKLVEMLKDKDYLVRGESLCALFSIDPLKSYQSIIGALQGDESLWVRYKAANLLEFCSQEDRNKASAVLMRVVGEDESEGVREISAEVLGLCVKTDDIMNCLQQALKDEDINVRLTAAGALGKLGCREGHKIALDALVDEEGLYDTEIRDNAAKALGDIDVKDEDTICALKWYLERECIAYQALKKLGNRWWE